MTASTRSGRRTLVFVGVTLGLVAALSTPAMISASRAAIASFGPGGATATSPAVRLKPPAPPPASVPSGTIPSSFPSGSNTGVPAGVVLSPYTGPCTITAANTVIDAKTINCTLVIQASNVRITRSKINGNVDSDSSGVSVALEDVEIDGGASQEPAVGYRSVTMRRVNVHGARVSVLCGDSCDIQDSWLHGQYMEPGSDWHVNGYLSNGGSNVIVRHNTLACDVKDNSNGGGCTGPAASFGDFSALSNIVYDGNLLVASPGSYCLYAGYNPSKPYGSNPSGIVVTNNVFQRGSNSKCAYYGPVSAFKPGSGNVWSNNVWDNGGTVAAAT
jgi:hypothetical protein